MSQASVLYDVPGPRAIARNRILGVVTVAAVIAVLGWIVWRMAETGQFSASKWEAFAYQTIWAQILQGLQNTLGAFVVAAIGALALGFVLAIARLSDHRAVRIPAAIVTEVLRAVPVLIFMMLLYYALPVLGPRLPPYWAVVIALIAYNGSVLAEVIRAGVESLPRGQKEAGYAIGLRKSGVMRLILMPQAIRSMLPVIIAQLVVTLKDTALGFIITFEELLFIAKRLGSAATLDRPIIQSTIVIGAIYIAICLLLSWVATIAQRRVSASPRAAGGKRPGNAGGATDTQLLLTQRGVDANTGNAVGGGGTLGLTGRAPDADDTADGRAP
ncbi:amino acid ABC transporter permease [Agrococcus terreus]|uniref:Amino acid ABC transporter permease n=1 Tax=Agrococcus terreus TaxID=574649 RepID=A0ABQ2KLN7_9MICO|nr:amino acid ABC transporter permease [Agrococcus terreus]GGN86136.1 amino acid ABC transporter permease [Agrococcus terreus]